MSANLAQGLRRALVLAALAGLGSAPFTTIAGGEVVTATWHVSLQGNDTTGDGSLALPFATIQHAIDVAQSGDTVLIANGTYTGPGNHDLWIQNKGLTLASAGGVPAACIIDCQKDAAGRARGLTLAAGYTVYVSGLSIVHAFGDAIAATGISLAGGLHVTNCLLDDAGDAGIEVPYCHLVVLGGEISRTSVGIKPYGGSSPSGLSYEAQGVRFTANGLGAYLPLDDVSQLTGCWFTGNVTGVSGPVAKGDPAGAKMRLQASCAIVDCHFVGNGYGVRMDMVGEFRRCDFSGHTTAAVSLGWQTSQAAFDSCTIRDNPGDGIVLSAAGGGLDIRNTSILRNGGRGVGVNLSWIYSGISIVNSLVAGNGGAGLQITVTGGAGPVAITGSTVTANGTGVEAAAPGPVAFANTIVAFNVGEGLCVATATYADCVVYANGSDLCPDGWTPGSNGNYAVDPRFCAPAQGDWALAANSPCAPAPPRARIGALDVGCGPVYLGTIDIDVEPGTGDTPWRIEGPGGLVASGRSDTTLTRLPPGGYLHRWLPGDGWAPPLPATISVQLAPDGVLTLAGTYQPRPFISGVADVGNDQGRQVRLVWNRSAHDAPGSPSPILQYGIYRRQGAARTSRDLVPTVTKLAGWDFVINVPARGDATYQAVVPTLCDSTAACGICWSTFVVSAQTGQPLVFFDSAPDSGYSVDNLRPLAPAGLQVAFGAERNILGWQAPSDPDVVSYRVFRRLRTSGGWPAGDVPVADVRATTWTDELIGAGGPGWVYTYGVCAVDAAGNISARSSPTAVGEGGVPLPALLLDSAPNPFNPATTLRYSVDWPCVVTLEIHDLQGRRVRSLRAGVVEPAGPHAVAWDGRDDAGRTVAAGVYTATLRAGERQATRRLTMIK